MWQRSKRKKVLEVAVTVESAGMWSEMIFIRSQQRELLSSALNLQMRLSR